MNVRCRKALPHEHERVLAFLQEISPGYGFNGEWFRWKYLDNPMGPAHVYFAEDPDRGVLAGIYCMISWNLMAGGRVISSAQSVDTMIHPDYRGQGLVKRLSELMLDDLRSINVELIFGFPNQNFFKTTVKIGWRHLGCMKTYVSVLSIGKICGEVPRWAPRSVVAFLDGLLNLRNTVQRRFYRDYELYETDGLQVQGDGMSHTDMKIRTVKTNSYFLWRYHDNPMRTYRFFCLSKFGKGVCWIVARSMNNETSIIDIVPADGNDAFILPALVLFTGHMRKEGCVALWFSGMGTILKQLRASGFIYREKGLPINVYALSRTLPPSWGTIEGWDLVPGDIDAM